MKKALLVVLSAGLCISAATAQPFKQAGNENNLQLLLAPLGNNPVSLNDGGIMYRRFFSNGTMAIRLGISVGSDKFTEVTQNANDTLTYPSISTFTPSGGGFPGFSTDTLIRGFNPELQNESKTSSFTINPGFEKHFTGTDRLSPYVGFEIYFSSSKTTFKKDTLVEGNFATGVLYDTVTTSSTFQAPWTKYTLNQKSGSSTFGVNLIAGADYYFTKNLSLGVEFGFGFYSTKNKDFESEYVDVDRVQSDVTPVNPNFPFGPQQTSVTQTSAVKSNEAVKGSKSSGFGPNVVTKLKIGWLF